jgi:hypothetical protein
MKKIIAIFVVLSAAACHNHNAGQKVSATCTEELDCYLSVGRECFDGYTITKRDCDDKGCNFAATCK